MSDYVTPKIALLSALYFIIALVLLFFVDVGIYYFINGVVLDIFNWFNRLSLFFKITLVLIGGTSLFYSLLMLVQRITTILGGFIFNRLPQNLFTVISTFIISIGNAILNIIWVWRIPEHYNFWIICELIILSGFIWSLSAIVMPAKEQMKDYAKQDRY